LELDSENTKLKSKVVGMKRFPPFFFLLYLTNSEIEQLKWENKWLRNRLDTQQIIEVSEYLSNANISYATYMPLLIVSEKYVNRLINLIAISFSPLRINRGVDQRIMLICNQYLLNTAAGIFLSYWV
jgi:hypothetical protein